MKTVNIHDAKTNLSRLITDVENGKSTIIAKAGKPVAELNPLGGKPKRRFGTLKGKFKVMDDIDTPFAAEIEEMFYGTPDVVKNSGRAKRQ